MIGDRSFFCKVTRSLRSEMSGSFRGKVVVSRRVVLESSVCPAGIFVSADGKISKIIGEEELKNLPKDESVIDFGDLAILPGVVDSHVHVNEPGRTEWEGFWTATQAAAAGGVTTIVDMPLNSIPPTTTVENLKAKLDATEGKIHVDVAFWGGLVPDNHDSLLPLVEAGVVGFKCFLCPSGVDEFPHVSEQDIRKALQILKGTDSVLAFHAELAEISNEEQDQLSAFNTRPDEYITFLRSRPDSMENRAVEVVCKLCAEYNVRCHIVHASSYQSVLTVLEARSRGVPISFETCHHYLTLNVEEVQNGDTSYKCCPPIRSSENKVFLWEQLKKGKIPMVVSDHSPCPPSMKKGDFFQAWGGISSLQFGLRALWTEFSFRRLGLVQLSQLLSSGPADLCRLTQKGSISVGKDADFVVFDPEEESVLQSEEVLHRHKVSPYIGKKLMGSVRITILRGDIIYKKGQDLKSPQGRTISNLNF